MEDQGASQSGSEDQGGSQSEEYKVVIGGEEQTVPLDELISGYQRQADYTQKTQELSGEKERYEALVEQKATELYLKALEDQEGNGSTAEGHQTSADKFQQELQQMRERLESTESKLETKEADQQLDSILGGLRDKFPDMDEEKVLIRFHNEAQEHDDPSTVFEQYAKESHDQYGEMRKKIIDDYVAKKSVSPFNAGETGGSTSPASKASKPVDTFEEARARAEARLRGEL